MNNSKTDAIQAIKDAQNVLVTVSQNPSVDQLSAAIGMTLVLNKIGKHGSAVFSGEVPSTIEFLKPEETIERNTDSLRDFIIALDKSKADKLRYKVEDQHVKIFITPYKTTIGQEDLEFSHGDFNVDLILALGVHQQSELDQAITAHGRILHDAKIVTVNTNSPGELGTINVNDQNTSSLAETLAYMSTSLKEGVLDEQIATAFLTGIVSETVRFSNEKTKPETMTISAKLMAAGANQQLVATKLEVKPDPPEPAPPAETPGPNQNTSESQETADSVKHDDGSLEIKHDDPQPLAAAPEPIDLPVPQPEPEVNPNEIHVDDHGNFKSVHEGHDLTQAEEAPALEEPEIKATHSRRMLDAPPNGDFGGSQDDSSEEFIDPLAPPKEKGPILSHDRDSSSTLPQETKPEPETNDQPKPASATEEVNSDAPSDADAVVNSSQTLETIEKAVDSPHVQEDDGQTEPSESIISANNDDPIPELASLQSAVDDALSKVGDQSPLEPISALNANPVDLNLDHEQNNDSSADDFLDVSKLDGTTGLPKPDQTPQQENDAIGPPPPPVPPPMMPPLPGDDNDGLTLPPVNN